MSFIETSMDLSKKVPTADGQGNEYQKIGELAYFVPTLDEFGITAEIKKDADTGQHITDDDGLPVYTDPKADFAMSAIVAAIKAGVRNKVVSGTTELKAGAKIARNWDELLAESGQRGEALKIIAEAKRAFAAYVQGLDKSARVKTALSQLFGNKQGLSLQPAAFREKFIKIVSDFAETLDETNFARYSKYLESLEEICSAEEISLD